MRFSSLGLFLIIVMMSGGMQLPSSMAQEQANVIKVGKLTAKVPADWQKEKPANLLRSYQFKLPGAEDFAQPQLAVFPESHPDPEKNFPKWKSQFVPPEGKTIDDIATDG